MANGSGTLANGNRGIEDAHKLFAFDDDDDAGSGGGNGGGDSGGGGDTDAPFGRTKTGRIRKRPVGGGGGTRVTTQKKAVSLSAVKEIAGALSFFHTLTANLIKVPELAMGDTEALMLAEAVDGVLESHEVEIDPRAIAWTKLAGVVSIVYGSRFMAYNARMKEEAKKRVN